MTSLTTQTWVEAAQVSERRVQFEGRGNMAMLAADRKHFATIRGTVQEEMSQQIKCVQCAMGFPALLR